MARAACLVLAFACAACTTASGRPPAARGPSSGSAVITVGSFDFPESVLGAFEAALIAGLAGAGMSSGLAVSAVLLFRLAAYWLPVAPGWVSLRLLQRWDYV
jgi:uncharacterized membrane protein YbhN (UPF0104 family)